MSSSTLAHLSLAIDRLTPLDLAERSWDNVGLMIEAPESRDDLTAPVCASALSSPHTTAILTYHPPIFSGLKSLTLRTPLQASLLRCIAQGVSVFTIHTAADNAVGGVNDYMGSGLLAAAGAETDQDGMIRPGQGKGIRALSEAKDAPEGHEGAGGGRVVDLVEGAGRTLARDEVVQAVKARLGLKHLQAAYSPTGASQIRTIAICAGSGSGVLKGVKADLYLTGEMGHWSVLLRPHDILAANAAGIHVLCCNHSATERPWLSYLAPRLEKAMNELAGEGVEYEVIVSEEDREPLVVV
ncbi:SPOSA6832_03498, partial [Sporobolomyces salmonicolor]